MVLLLTGNVPDQFFYLVWTYSKCRIPCLPSKRLKLLCTYSSTAMCLHDVHKVGHRYGRPKRKNHVYVVCHTSKLQNSSPCV